MKNFFISDIDNITPGKEVHVKGWAQDIRLMKNIAFIIVRDSTGLVQATVKRDCPDFHKLETLSRESVVEITGTVPEKVQSNIGREILVTSVELINMAEVPLPIGITDNVETDMDTRFNSRFLDLRKPEIGRIFQAKSAILWGIRNFLMSQGFTEVQTPKTVSAATEGGAELFHVKYFEKNIFLNQSPQLYKDFQKPDPLGKKKIFIQ